MAKNILGINIGEHLITMAIVSRSDKQVVPIALALEQIPINMYINESEEAENKIVALVKKMLSEAKITLRNAAIILPDAKSYMRITEAPALTEKELISAIRYQADQFIPLPIEQVSLDIEVLKEDKKNKKKVVFLVAAAETYVDRISRVVEKAGLIPQFLENETTSLFRLLSKYVAIIPQGPNPGYFMFINIGISATSIVLYDMQAKLPIATLGLSIGYDLFVRDLKSNLQLDEVKINQLLQETGFSQVAAPYQIAPIIQGPFDELTKEINHFLMVIKDQTNIGISRIFLLGEGNLIADLDKKISQTMGVPTSTYDLTAIVKSNNVSSYFQKSLGLFIPAIGAAIKET